nr:MAG TPA: hypothetical protein [Caudoviricetes sp.]
MILPLVLFEGPLVRRPERPSEKGIVLEGLV